MHPAAESPPEVVVPRPPKVGNRVYLAARYSRREELCQYRRHLETFGYVVTSRWLNGNHQIDDAGLSIEAKAAERERFACEDWNDLMEADICISFTETPRSSNSSGGRHVEYGAALANGARCIVVGPRENVFHCLPTVEVFEDWITALFAIRPAHPIPFASALAVLDELGQVTPEMRAEWMPGGMA